MIIIFKSDHTYQKYNLDDDEQILNELKKMSKKELDETEIAIFMKPDGDSVKFALYPDGTYEPITKEASFAHCDSGQRLVLASQQVIQAKQYDMCGCYVVSNSEGTRGKVIERVLTPIGVKYTVEKKDGTLFQSYDADLEVVRKASNSGIEREHIRIENLSQLKQKIKCRDTFIIRNHWCTKYIGEIRKPLTVKKKGFYSVVINDPYSRYSVESGEGIWMDFGKDADWEIQKNLCHLYEGEHLPENFIWTIEFLE